MDQQVIRVGLVGLGKIARDQHVPAIMRSPHFALAATASPEGGLDGVLAYDTVEAMLAEAAIDAVVICTPPGPRARIAQQAIAHGLPTMLEKPPAATVTEAVNLAEQARVAGVTLFASWHSRAADCVGQARAWLADKTILSARINWREDIRHWHPGQLWLLGPGGFGVFDPGINALSILTAILPHNVELQAAILEIPRGSAAPIRAFLNMHTANAPISAEFDFLQTGEQIWDIDIETNAGPLRLSSGGRILTLPEHDEISGTDDEYSKIYDRFADLIARKESDVDLEPLLLVADAFLVGDRRETAPFTF